MICDATPKLGHSVVAPSVYIAHLYGVKDYVSAQWLLIYIWVLHCG